jgi:hypothetical protein
MYLAPNVGPFEAAEELIIESTVIASCGYILILRIHELKNDFTTNPKSL